MLDDGFQHRRLARDSRPRACSTPRDPFGNGRLLPAGPLREPLEGSPAPTSIVLTRAGWIRPDDRSSRPRPAALTPTSRCCAPGSARRLRRSVRSPGAGTARRASRSAGSGIRSVVPRDLRDAGRRGGEVRTVSRSPPIHRARAGATVAGRATRAAAPGHDREGPCPRLQRALARRVPRADRARCGSSRSRDDAERLTSRASGRPERCDDGSAAPHRGSNGSRSVRSCGWRAVVPRRALSRPADARVDRLTARRPSPPIAIDNLTAGVRRRARRPRPAGSSHDCWRHFGRITFDTLAFPRWGQASVDREVRYSRTSNTFARPTSGARRAAVLRALRPLGADGADAGPPRTVAVAGHASARQPGLERMLAELRGGSGNTDRPQAQRRARDAARAARRAAASRS